MFYLIMDSMFELVTTSLESLLISYLVNYYCNNGQINKKKFWLSFVLISIVQSNIFTRLFDLVWMRTFVSVLLTFIIICMIFKETIIKAVTAVSVSMLTILSIIMLMQENVYVFFMNYSSISINVRYIWRAILIVRWINVILQLKYKEKITKFFGIVMSEGVYIISFSLILNIAAVLSICSSTSRYGFDSEILKDVLLLMFYIFLVCVLFYIVRVLTKSSELNKMNLELECNNSDLRKIKHDYGAQISYLYGLCLMERFRDLKTALKDIIEKSKYASSEVKDSSESMMELAIKQAIDKNDIKVSIDERAKLYLIDMPEMELFRVIFNIAHNAVEAMGGKGNITAKSLVKNNKIVIVIENDGPEIPREYIDKVFSTGFTTKDNRGKGHGYGLSIVKEIIEKYNGTISVTSSSKLTQFKIVFLVHKKDSDVKDEFAGKL